METQYRSASNDAAIANIGAETGRRRITQKRLAQLLGMSQAAISDRQRGHTPWSLAELDRVAELFGLPVTELLRESPFPGSRLADSSPNAAATLQYGGLSSITRDDLELAA